jgi:hypothetical protein
VKDRTQEEWIAKSEQENAHMRYLRSLMGQPWDRLHNEKARSWIKTTNIKTLLKLEPTYKHSLTQECWSCCSCRWGETMSLNCGHQSSYCSYTQYIQRGTHINYKLCMFPGSARSSSLWRCAEEKVRRSEVEKVQAWESSKDRSWKVAKFDRNVQFNVKLGRVELG